MGTDRFEAAGLYVEPLAVRHNVKERAGWSWISVHDRKLPLHTPLDFGAGTSFQYLQTLLRLPALQLHLRVRLAPLHKQRCGINLFMGKCDPSCDTTDKPAAASHCL